MVGFVAGSLGGATVESCDCTMRASVTGIWSCDPAMYSNSSHDLVIRSCDGRGESAVSGSSRLKQSGMTTTNSSSEPDASLSDSAEKEVHVHLYATRMHTCTCTLYYTFCTCNKPRQGKVRQMEAFKADSYT